jgi:Ras-related protein Rab-1A
VKVKKLDGGEESQKKGRKRRNTETGGRPPAVAAEEDLNLPCLPSFKSVLVGDIVKVYYGPSGETKVIYEAKVVDIETDDSGQPVFLVHYAGWNSRYDEWVKRSKIADNLSWTPARGSRRAKTTPIKVSQHHSRH